MLSKLIRNRELNCDVELAGELEKIELSELLQVNGGQTEEIEIEPFVYQLTVDIITVDDDGTTSDEGTTSDSGTTSGGGGTSWKKLKKPKEPKEPKEKPKNLF